MLYVWLGLIVAWVFVAFVFVRSRLRTRPRSVDRAALLRKIESVQVPTDKDHDGRF